MIKKHSNIKKYKRPKQRSLSDIRRKDPFFDREMERYDYPLPSREYILSILKQHDHPVSPEALAAYLDIRFHELSDFFRRISAMLNAGQLFLNRKGLLLIPDKAGLLQGCILAHRDGFGFFVPDQGGEDLYLSPREMTKVLNGDSVLVKRRREAGRSSAIIVEVVKRAHQEVVGRLTKEQGVWLLAPENPVLPQMLIANRSERIRPKPKSGDIVIATIIEQPSEYRPAIVEVKRIVGNIADPEIEVEILAHCYGLALEFPKAVQQLAQSRTSAISAEERANRVDLRQLPLITIDGQSARDFDDAVYGETTADGFRLVVAIADVSHYVQAGDELDIEAQNRGNSVYFPTRVLPMLPEALSNHMCSLVPNEDRLSMVCDIMLDSTGTIKTYRFYPAVICSKARLTYDAVYRYLYTGDSKTELPFNVCASLQTLKKLCEALSIRRNARGSIDFEIPETQIIFNEQKKIEKIIPTERNDAHRLIEECMLAANICAANFLIEHHLPGVYRVHAAPKSEKLEELRRQLDCFGLTLKGGHTPAPSDFAKLLQTIHKNKQLSWLQMLVLRTLAQAVYQTAPEQHFALAYPIYTHFTSPIRRYPDLIVHRLIKAGLNNQSPFSDVENLTPIASHCSMTERRADQATREAAAWLKCDYMQDKLGMVFSGSITHISAIGVFVLLDDIFVEGLVHIAELGKDYFEYDPEHIRIVGKRSGYVYRIGDRLQVQVASVNTHQRQIDFVLAESAGPKTETYCATSSFKEKEKRNNRKQKRTNHDICHDASASHKKRKKKMKR